MKTLFQIIIITIIIIVGIFLSILPTMGEITVYEQDGVLYVSNVYTVEVHPTKVSDTSIRRCQKGYHWTDWGCADDQSEEADTKDSISSETEYDKEMSRASIFGYWAAGEYELYRQARFLKAETRETENYPCSASYTYRAQGYNDDANRVELLCTQKRLEDAQESDAKGEFLNAAQFYENIKNWSEMERLMALQKEKMQNTPADN